MNIKMLKEGMKIEARHVRRKQLTQYIDVNYLKRERKSSDSINTSSGAPTSKKQPATDVIGNSQKRSKLHESVSSVRRA